MILPLALSIALLAEPPPPSIEEIQQWLTYYYLKPRPELTLPSLAVMEREFQKNGKSMADLADQGGLRTFYANVFAQNPALVEAVASKLPSLSDGQQAFVREALRRCATPRCAGVLKAPLMPTPDAQQRMDPGALDDAWAAFFATGEARYVTEIIGALAMPQSSGDVNRALTVGAARWSLSSNAYQHGRVLSICEGAAAAASGPAKDVLQVIVDQARSARAKKPPPEPAAGLHERPTRVAPSTAPRAPDWPADVPRPNLSGFWKNDCAENFGLWIAAARNDLYSISFCGPGGCFAPGTYRPDSAVFGDSMYRVQDARTLEVLGADGFSTYTRCADRP